MIASPWHLKCIPKWDGSGHLNAKIHFLVFGITDLLIGLSRENLSITWLSSTSQSDQWPILPDVG
jgi:hypothetical protein